VPYSEIWAAGGIAFRVETPRHCEDVMAIARMVKLGRQRALAALAEVEAKRRILDRYEDALARQTDPDESQMAADIQVREYEDWIIPAIAQPYAGQPGWREQWRA
jgi:acyl-coenzyme A thioesterase PaaI-like protein